MDLISDKRPVAKKSYVCMASEWIVNGGIPGGMTFAERRGVIRAKRNNWCVRPGERYVYQTGVCCGDFQVFKAIEAIHTICLKYDLYEDVC